MALIEHHKTEDGQYELVSKVDAGPFLVAVDKAYRRENKKINIQGFRKGKTPRAVIERMYGEDFFYEDAINDLLPNLFADAIEEAGIEYIGRPAIDVEEAGVKSGLTVKFTVKLRPELAVKKYKGVSGTKVITPVEQTDINEEIDRMRERASRMVSVEDRPAQDGDTVTIDFEGFKDGVPFEGGKGEDYDLVLGSGQFIPGFEEKVVGHNAGDEFDIDIQFPEEYGAADLAGQDAVFHIKLKAIRFKELPELDDEFAKDVSEFDTLAELKKDIQKKLQDESDERAKTQLENDLVDAVAETLEGDIPDEMVEDRMDEMVRDFDYRLRSQGMDLETYLKYTGFDMENFRNTFKEQAQKHVKTRLALEAVACAEKIGVSEEDKEKEYKKLSEMYNVEADKIKEIIPEKEIVADIQVSKAIDVIRDNAKVKEEKAKKEPQADSGKSASDKKAAEPKKEEKSESE